MALVKGVHHVALKCPDNGKYEKVKKFYRETLELPFVREWDGGIMYAIGDSLMEIFNSGDKMLPQGAIRHFALATEDTDKAVEKVRDAGYQITMEPQDIVIQSNPPFPARIAFCLGPLGEEIEFFQEK